MRDASREEARNMLKNRAAEYDPGMLFIFRHRAIFSVLSSVFKQHFCPKKPLSVHRTLKYYEVSSLHFFKTLLLQKSCVQSGFDEDRARTFH